MSVPGGQKEEEEGEEEEEEEGKEEKSKDFCTLILVKLDRLDLGYSNIFHSRDCLFTEYSNKCNGLTIIRLFLHDVLKINTLGISSLPLLPSVCAFHLENM